MKKFFQRSPKDILIALIPIFALLGIAIFIFFKFVDPAPPNRIVISTSDGEGDYMTYAKLYQDILKDDGIKLEIRPSTGALENYDRLRDPKSDVEVGFVQDGLGSTDEAPDLESLGSLYYEPIWVFYRGKTEITRFSQLQGKKIGAGKTGGGTRLLALRLLKASGVDETNTTVVSLSWEDAANALRKGDLDAVIFLATPDEPLIKELMADATIRLMSVDQAEATTRVLPYLHHLVLPHGAIDLKRNLPAKDVDLVSPTATLLIRDSLDPALIYLLLKAASQVHGDPGIFEKKDEFPIDKDFQFPLSAEAKSFYKTGTPFWQRYLPFWIATLVDRFLLLVLPLLALIIPTIKLIPRFLNWRVRTRIYKRYGELKYLETQVKNEGDPERRDHHLRRLDEIEDGVNHLKVPLDFAEHIYVLREHIDFVRNRLRQKLKETPPPPLS